MKKIPKPLRAITGMTLALIAALVFTTCQSLGSVFREPQLSFNSAELADLSFIGANILCRVNVENPNAFDIPFPDIDWEFFVNANSFINGTIKVDQASIKGRGTTVVDVPVGFNYLELFNTFASLKGNNQADYRIALSAKFAIPLLGDKVWNIEHKGRFPLLKVPSVSFAGISVRNLDLSSIDIDVAWDIENTNSFAITVNDFAYDLRVNNARWASGKVQGTPQIGSNGKTTIPLTISINSISLVRDITEFITRGTDIAFVCNGNMNLGADLPGVNDFYSPFNFSGTTRLRR